jgi:hypothetical protein
MTKTAIPVFYDVQRGGIRCVSGIKDMFNVSQITNPDNYETIDRCLLADPYEGIEIYADLF